MKNLQVITVRGNLTTDAQVINKDDKSFVKIVVAVNYNNESANYYDCIIFNNNTEFISLLKKGSSVIVSGEFSLNPIFKDKIYPNLSIKVSTIDIIYSTKEKIESQAE